LISANAKYSDKEIFRKLIRRQNQYLAHHRNIPMDGFEKSVFDEIMLGANLTRIDPCLSSDYNGRHNFTTTEQHFVAAVEWLDTALPAIIVDIPEDERGEFEFCVERIYPRDTTSSHSTTKNASRKSMTSYLSALTSSFDSDNSADTATPKIRRKSRYNPMIEFDFVDMIGFPTLPTAS
jgi:hypothetical protein